MHYFLRLHTEAIRSHLETQGLKRYWVAEQAGVHKTTLRRWLSHRIEKVKPENVKRLASVLGLRDIRSIILET